MQAKWTRKWRLRQGATKSLGMSGAKTWMRQLYKAFESKDQLSSKAQFMSSTVSINCDAHQRVGSVCRHT